MSSIIKNLSTLHYSPIILKDVIGLFYKDIESTKNNILLSYLILPFYCNEKTFSFFKNARRSKSTGGLTSSLITFNAKKENTSGLAEKIIEFKALTNTCIQIIVDSDSAIIYDNMSLRVKDFNIDLDSNRKKAILNMAEILTEFDVVSTYRMLGIREI
ncbi:MULTISPECIES: three component ABC system middle component [unclassified Serratia (in: enterobacteria)]|uniref:three component ABC system middle component n=1 Tax=unclassified Serratia (in: enterobacteria) TaxID=2647522 RepID=UPI000469FA29|nr:MULTISPECIES: three component ABC system middle component [unclassified Serratia (in: enterobacteria)]